MKKFLLAAAAVAALSTAAYADNAGAKMTDSNSPDYSSTIKDYPAPHVLKKKIYSSNSTSSVGSVSSTGNVSDEERILEKNGNSHDVSQ